MKFVFHSSGIPYEVWANPVFVDVPSGSIHGTVYMVGLQTHGGTSVFVQGFQNSATTKPNGEFTLTDVPEGDAVIFVAKWKYLVEKVSVRVAVGQTTEVGQILMRVGDLNWDASIDLTDVTLLARACGARSGGDSDARCDLNEDGTVDLVDLALLMTNYHQTGDRSWME